MTLEAINVVGLFVVECQFLGIFRDYRQRLAFLYVYGPEVAGTTGLDGGRGAILQNVRSQCNVSFGSHERLLEIRFRLIGVMTLDAGRKRLAVRIVVLRRVVVVI